MLQNLWQETNLYCLSHKKLFFSKLKILSYYSNFLILILSSVSTLSLCHSAAPNILLPPITPESPSFGLSLYSSINILPHWNLKSYCQRSNPPAWVSQWRIWHADKKIKQTQKRYSRIQPEVTQGYSLMLFWEWEWETERKKRSEWQ